MKQEHFFIPKYFQLEAENVLNQVPKGDFTFALITDTHLSDTRDNTCANIRYLDNRLHYRCLMHLGDFLCGNIPDYATRRVLKDEIDVYRNAIGNGIMYVAQGNHDGYCDENYRDGTYGQRDMALDEIWYDATKYMDEFVGMVRPENKPYYYVDFQDVKLRFIVLCTTWYQHNKEHRVYRKQYGICSDQVRWVANEALRVPSEGWSVMAFSHITGIPMSGRTSSSYHYGGKEVVEMLKAFRDGGAVQIDDCCYTFEPAGHNVLAWCAGHGHGDVTEQWDSINFVCTACQLPNVPVTWEQPLGYFPAPRVLGTATEDVWETITWIKNERKLVFNRFGAGESRILYY